MTQQDHEFRLLQLQSCISNTSDTLYKELKLGMECSNNTFERLKLLSIFHRVLCGLDVKNGHCLTEKEIVCIWDYVWNNLSCQLAPENSFSDELVGNILLYEDGTPVYTEDGGFIYLE